MITTFFAIAMAENIGVLLGLVPFFLVFMAIIHVAHLLPRYLTDIVIVATLALLFVASQNMHEWDATKAAGNGNAFFALTGQCDRIDVGHVSQRSQAAIGCQDAHPGDTAPDHVLNLCIWRTSQGPGGLTRCDPGFTNHERVFPIGEYVSYADGCEKAVELYADIARKACEYARSQPWDMDRVSRWLAPRTVGSGIPDA